MKKKSGFLFGLIVLIGVVGCGGGSSTPPVVANPASVSPAAVNVPIGGTQQFTGTGFSGAITWTINPQVGTIDVNGLYHAPASFPSPDNLTVTASGGGLSAGAAATVVFPNNNALAQSAPIALGTSGANINDVGTKVCCIGTLGSLWTRGTGTFILSNNHVLDRSGSGVPGEAIQQPGQAACFKSLINVANLTQGAALIPSGTTQGRTGPAPSNVDAAIAAIIPGAVDPTGAILDLGAPGATSVASAPPSSVAPIPVPSIGMAVAKSGRTTGLTCSTITSTNADIVIAYETSCGTNITAFNATFRGQVVINGGNFSAGGDSGSLVVNSGNARPVALLYGGSTVDTVANPLQDAVDSQGHVAPGVLTALNNGSPLAVVGGADHAVSCAPTASAASKQVGAFSASVPLSAQERQRVAAVQGRAGALLTDPAISSVTIGTSADHPGEGALVVSASRSLAFPVPQVIDGVRTRVVFADSSTAPAVGQLQIDHALAVKDAHVAEFLGKPGIQGVGVSVSVDNPAESAVSIYVIQGEVHPPIPAVLDGVRTRIFEGPRFKAF
jgi:hypothetical protein